MLMIRFVSFVLPFYGVVARNGNTFSEKFAVFNMDGAGSSMV